MKSLRRIQAIADAVAFASEKFDKKIVVADIGTDHGYVAEILSKSEFTKKVIATDISEKSLSKLQNLIKLNNLTKIETKVGNGLDAIEFADITVIAGMGGFEITKMIDFQNKTKPSNQGDIKRKNKCNIFVLQPAQNIVELRFWAMKHHYKILKDYTIQDTDRFYPILIIDVSKFTITKKSIFNLWIGRDSKENVADFENFMVYLDSYLSFLSNISKKRAKQDKMLYQKYKLNKIVKKYLK